MWSSTPNRRRRPSRSPPPSPRRRASGSIRWRSSSGRTTATRRTAGATCRPPSRSGRRSTASGRGSTPRCSSSPRSSSGRALYQVNNQGDVEALTKPKGKMRLAQASSARSRPPRRPRRRAHLRRLPHRATGSAGGLVAAMRPRDGKVLWKRPLPSRTESSPLYLNGTRLLRLRERDDLRAEREDRQDPLDVPGRRGGQGRALARRRQRSTSATTAAASTRSAQRDGHLVWRTTTERLALRPLQRQLLLDARRSPSAASTSATPTARCTRSPRPTRASSPGRRAPAPTCTPRPRVAQVPGGQPTVYFGSYDGTFYAVDARSGATRWSYQVRREDLRRADVVGNIVYFSNSGHADHHRAQRASPGARCGSSTAARSTRSSPTAGRSSSRATAPSTRCSQKGLRPRRS